MAWHVCKNAVDEDHQPKCMWITKRELCNCKVLLHHPEYGGRLEQLQNLKGLTHLAKSTETLIQSTKRKLIEDIRGKNNAK